MAGDLSRADVKRRCHDQLRAIANFQDEGYFLLSDVGLL